MNKQELHDWLVRWRPTSEIYWANDKALFVGSTGEDSIGEYGPNFVVNLTVLQDTDEGKFSGLHIGTKMVSPGPVPLSFVNELNQNFRFVRHAVFEENSIGVMLDIAEDSDELTSDVLRKYMFFFIESVKRLKIALPTS